MGQQYTRASKGCWEVELGSNKLMEMPANSTTVILLSACPHVAERHSSYLHKCTQPTRLILQGKSFLRPEVGGGARETDTEQEGEGPCRKAHEVPVAARGLRERENPHNRVFAFSLEAGLLGVGFCFLGLGLESEDSRETANNRPAV